MATFSATRIGSPIQEPSEDLLFISSGVRQGIAGQYDPHLSLVHEVRGSSVVSGGTSPVHSAFATVTANTPPPFGRGIHFTYGEELMDLQPISFGVVSDVVPFTLNVQHMSKHKGTVASIDVATSQGINISGIDAGTVFDPYQQIPLQVTISADGSPVINTDIAIKIVGDSATYFVTVVGFRFSISQPLQPNWESGLSNTRRFLTSVFSSYQGGETRKALKDIPTLQQEATLSVIGPKAMSYAWNMAKTRNQGANLLPLFSDEIRASGASSGTTVSVNPTFRRFFKDGYGIIVEFGELKETKKLSIFKIADLGNSEITTEYPLSESFEAGASVFPVMQCYPSFGEDSMDLLAESLGTMGVVGTESLNENLLGQENREYVPTTRSGYPAFDFDLQWADGAYLQSNMVGDLEESGRGSIFSVLGVNPYDTIDVLVSALNREEFWRLAGFLNHVRGMAGAFWVRSPRNFFDISDPTASSFIVQGLDSVEWSDLKYVWIADASGDVDVRKVTSTAKADAGTVITFEASEIAGFAPVSYGQAMFARLGSDEVTEEWLTADLCEMSFNIVELSGGYE